MDSDDYDKETTDIVFSHVDYSKFKYEPEDFVKIQVKNTSPIEQITVEALIRIWKMIFKSYAMAKSNELLEPENIMNYIKSELNFSKSYWSGPNLDKRIFKCYQRLKNFINHINANEIDNERKNTIRQYIVRVIAIIFKYPGKAQDASSNRIKKLLRSVIHSCDDKINTGRMSKGRSVVFDESPTAVDIDALISQLHGSNLPSAKERKFSRDKLNFSIQTLLKEVSVDKTTPSKADNSKSLISSIYKDSPQYRYFASSTPTSSSYLDTIQIANKKNSILLENISSLERLKSGQWEETAAERKNIRNRTNIDKRVHANRTFRSKTKEFNLSGVISEESESERKESDQENDEGNGDSGNVSSVPELSEKDEEEDIISNQLQELIVINDTEKEQSMGIKFVKKSYQKKTVLGRKV